MKKTIITLVFITIVISICAQTPVSGVILENTTWNVNGSPYIVEGDVTVPLGIQLTVDAGVEVLFQEDLALIINGSILAQGNEIDQVIFDSQNLHQKWNGIQLIGSVSSIFQHCDISNSKNSGIILSNSSDIIISDCVIHNNTSDEGAGINIKENSTEITIQQSTINNNEGNIIEDEMVGGGGIVCSNSENIKIKLNDINNNETAYGVFNNGGGINLILCSNIMIDDNYISYNISLIFGGGIYVDRGENNWIKNNLIFSNSSENGYGGGIAIKTACNIVGNEIYDNIASAGGGIYATAWSIEREFKDNIIHHNIALVTGGGISIQGSGPYPEMENCEIYSNEAGSWHGGGLFILDADSYIINCKIFDNIALSGDGGGIYASCGSPQLYRSVLRNNKADNGGAIFLHDTVPIIPHPICSIDQCVIIGNEATDKCGGLYVEAIDHDNVSNVNCYNSIFFDNIAGDSQGNEIYIETIHSGFFSRIKYNCIEDFEQDGLYIMNNYYLYAEGNIEENPEFTNPDDYDYYLLPDSPCIDAGESSFHPPDPDGSPPDIGLIPFDHDDDIKYFHANYNWISFPRLPMDDPQNTNQPVFADNIVYDISPFPDSLGLLYADDINPVLEYYQTNWTPPNTPENYELYSSRGYKLKTDDPENTQITIDGPRLEPDTAIDLQHGENWVGYWLTESQDIDEAFGEEHFDKVVSVKAEDWEWKDMRPVRGPYDPVPIYYPIRPLQYGKGYVIRLREPIPNFQWQTGNLTMVEEIPKAQNFEYDVLPDYESVIIDTIEVGENVVEVGAFADETCIGAAVVEEYPVQLLAYTDGLNRSSELTFQVIGGGRGEVQSVRYSTLNLETGEFENMALIPGRFEHNIVRLNIKTLQEPEEEQSLPDNFSLDRNYPNPFNPTTTISFSVTQTSPFVTLEIFNIKGQKVKTLYSGIAEEGKHTLIWDGKDTNDKSVSSGIYFYKLKSDKKELTRKMLLLK